MPRHGVWPAVARAIALLLVGAGMLGCSSDASAPDVDAPPVFDAATTDGPDACSLPQASLPSHSPGTDCLSCHDGAGASALTIGGTVYSDTAGTSPLTQATVTVRDSAGAELSLVSTSSGNFLSHQEVTPPLTVAVSRCELSAAMPTPATHGNCNTSACHGSAPIHLP